MLLVFANPHSTAVRSLKTSAPASYLPLCHLVSLFLMIPPLHWGEPSNALCSCFFDLLISSDFFFFAFTTPLMMPTWILSSPETALPLTFPSAYCFCTTISSLSMLSAHLLRCPHCHNFATLSQLLIRISQPEKLEKYQCLGLFSRWLKSGKNSGGGPGHQWYYFLKAPQVIYTCRQGWEPLPNPCTLLTVFLVQFWGLRLWI